MQKAEQDRVLSLLQDPSWQLHGFKLELRYAHVYLQECFSYQLLRLQHVRHEQRCQVPDDDLVELQTGAQSL